LTGIGSPKVVVVRGLQPVPPNTDISDERLADWFGVGELTTAAIVVIHNDHVTDDLVFVYFREVSHLHHHPNNYDTGTTGATR